MEPVRIPRVLAYFDANAMDDTDYGTVESLMFAVKQACLEVIPAGLNSPNGPLYPGCTTFIAMKIADLSMDVDVCLDIQAHAYDDRVMDIDVRTSRIEMALKGFFPGLMIDLQVNPVIGGCASDTPFDRFEGDMSMPAAMSRALRTMHRTYPSTPLSR